MKRSVSALLFGGLALVLAVAALAVVGPASAATGGGGQIVVNSQDVSNGQVVVQSFNAPSAGWLLIQRASNGAPGAVIGFAPVAAGLNTGIRITVRTDVNFGHNKNSDNSNATNGNNEAVTSTLFASFAPDANSANPLATPPAGVERTATVLAAFGSAAPAASTAPTTGGVSPSTLPSSQATGAATARNPIVVSAQDVTANTVFVNSVFAAQDGWLLVRSGSQFGPVIGYSAVHAGLNSGVRVNIQLSRHQATTGSAGNVISSRELVTPQLWAELVADPNAANPFATPSSDVQNVPGYAMAAFSTSAPTAASSTGALAGQAPATGGQSISPSSQGAQGSPAALRANQIQVRPQDITANQVTLDSVNAAQDGWLLIHTDAGGRPGAVIGWAPVHAGLNQGVRVDIQLSRKQANLNSAGNVNSGRDYISPVLWATLNPDPAALTPFATPNSAVQGSGVIAVPFSSTAAGGVGFGASTSSGSAGK